MRVPYDRFRTKIVEVDNLCEKYKEVFGFSPKFRSKLTKRTALSNSTRKIIYNFVQSNIGSHFSLIKKLCISKDLKGNPGELIWHLDLLIKFNYISLCSSI